MRETAGPIKEERSAERSGKENYYYNDLKIIPFIEKPTTQVSKLPYWE